jgi:hypothetical protein
LPFPASTTFSDCSTNKRNCILADLDAAETACEGAVMRSTHEDHARSLQCWTQYLTFIGLGQDPFLNKLSTNHRNLTICASASAIREGRFSSKSHKQLATGTVRNTISNICATFRENCRQNPSKDKDLQPCFLIQQQFCAYKNKDPKEKQHKAIPICDIAEIAKCKATELQLAIGQLTTVALLFAMRSCE